jgi:hypothetical protein
VSAKYWPLETGRIVTSPYGPRPGEFHTGIDFGFPGGSGGRTVYAIRGGTVLYCGAADGYGSRPDGRAGWIVVDSDDADGGGVWEYGHIVRDPSVVVGARIEAGQRIAVINPDSATNGGVAPHLHVSRMPYAYDPSQKQDPAPALVDALEPPAAMKKDIVVPKPAFHEYPMWSPNSSSRNGVKPIMALIHTQEGPGNADSLARFLANPNSQVSYHYSVSQDPGDGGVTVVDCVDSDRASWSVLDFNSRAINLCFAGSSVAWTREQWMAQSKAIDVAAFLLVSDAKKYGFSTVVVPPPYTSGTPGISDHGYVTSRGIGTHTDCGPNFPWTYFAQCVSKYANATATPPPPPPAPAPAPVGPPPFKYPPVDAMVTQIWEQLFGPKAGGWSQLGGKTLVDAVAELMKK